MTGGRSLGGALLAVGVAVAGIAAPTATAAPDYTAAGGGRASEATAPHSTAAVGVWRYEVADRTSVQPGSDDPIATSASSGRVKAAFEPYGDEFWVKDKARDGFSAGVLYKVRHGKKIICRNKWGKGSWAICDLNLSERRDIRWKIAWAECEIHNCALRTAWHQYPRGLVVHLWAVSPDGTHRPLLGLQLIGAERAVSGRTRSMPERLSGGCPAMSPA